RTENEDNPIKKLQVIDALAWDAFKTGTYSNSVLTHLSRVVQFGGGKTIQLGKVLGTTESKAENARYSRMG
nr:hypothetical protein [Tanacetum cinerariifolium]